MAGRGLDWGFPVLEPTTQKMESSCAEWGSFANADALLNRALGYIAEPLIYGDDRRLFLEWLPSPFEIGATLSWPCSR